jgi:hypothetical protein
MKKIMFVALILFYCFNLYAASTTAALQPSASNKYYLTSDEQKLTWYYSAPKKNYQTALLLNILPGGGFIYYDEVGIGFLYIITTSGLIGIGIPGSMNGGTPLFIAMAIVGSIEYIVSHIHLAFIADDYDKRIKSQIGIPLSLNTYKDGIRLDYNF